MHYDFKQKCNSADSQEDEDYLVPEIDWFLNEAIEVYVKMIANPRAKNEFGFELNQRNIDDIRTIVVDQTPTNAQTVTVFDNGSYIAGLPTEYWWYLNSKVYGTKGSCSAVRMFTKEIQHDDEQDISPFERSSFFWRQANIRFNDQGIRIFNNYGEFVVNSLCLSYLKKPTEVHNAADWEGGTYTKLDGTVLTGRQDCTLPSPTHREIVDLAVLIATNSRNSPNYKYKVDKIGLTK
jgi:hypothetical protein